MAEPKTTIEALRSYSQDLLPAALDDMRAKQEAAGQVIDYCQNAYLTNDKDEVERQTREYLKDALQTIVTNVELVAANFNEFLGLQTESMDSLTSELNVLTHRLGLLKEQHSAKHLENQTVNLPNQDDLEKVELAEQRISKKYKTSSDMTLSQALGLLDSVGTSLVSTSSNSEMKSEYGGYQEGMF